MLPTQYALYIDLTSFGHRPNLRLSVRRSGQPRGVLSLGAVVVERAALAVVALLVLPLNALAALGLLGDVRPLVVVASSAAAHRPRAAGFLAGRPNVPLGPPRSSYEDSGFISRIFADALGSSRY